MMNAANAIKYLLMIDFTIFDPNSLAFMGMILNKNRVFQHKKKGDEKIHLLFSYFLITLYQVQNSDRCNSWLKQKFL